jgi:uncharacterized protein
MLQAILQNKLAEIRKLCYKYNVASLYAFGSVCTDKFNDNSDIDFLVSFHNHKIPVEDYADNYLDLIEELEHLLGKDVDLLSENSLKNPYLIKTIAKTKTPLYAG